MNRQKEVPAELLAYMERVKTQANNKVFNTLDIFCRVPVRAVRMRILRKDYEKEEFCTVIIPAVDVYTTGKAELKKGFFKRDALSFFVSGTHKAFPYGHVYDGSGTICLGSIFVPSAVPERSVTMPLETLFLHNDRNLSHGNSHLVVTAETVKGIESIIGKYKINPSVITLDIEKGVDIIRNDELWNLSADVVEQKPLPEALRIMSAIFDVIFLEERKKEEQRNKEAQRELEDEDDPDGYGLEEEDFEEDFEEEE